MIEAILDIIRGVLKAIPLLSKYFPPQSPQQVIEDKEKEIANEIQKIEKEGRP